MVATIARLPKWHCPSSYRTHAWGIEQRHQPYTLPQTNDGDGAYIHAHSDIFFFSFPYPTLHLWLFATHPLAPHPLPSSDNAQKTFFGGFLADIGWSDYGYYGYDMSGATPTIDQLASEGVKLNCVYGGIGCSPGRSQFLTGRYAIRHGIQKGGLNNKQAKGIPVNNTLIAAALSSVGKFSIIVDVIYFFS